MNKIILSSASFLGMLAITLGAFAAHGLEKLVDEYAISTFKTGVQYQMYNALFLFVVGVINTVSINTKKTIYFLVLFGVLFFSGSIYGLATNDLSSFDFKTIALVTPLGGLLFILAWFWFGISIVRSK